MAHRTALALDRRSAIRCLSFGSAALAAASASGCGEALPGTIDLGDSDLGSDAGFGLDVALDGGSGLDASVTDLGAGPDAGWDAGPASCEPTASDVTGPFFRPGAPSRASLVGAEEPGDRLEITGVVLDPDCQTPLDGAVIDVWQADAEGRYDTTSADYRLRALLMSDADGRFAFTSVRPGNYPDAGGMRPAHVHFTFSRPGYTPLTTQLYFEGDPFLAPNDSCGVCNSDEESLIIALTPEGRDGVTWWKGHFRVVLRS